MTITIVPSSRSKTIESCKDLHAASRNDHPGCAATDVVAHACTIYVVRPTETDDSSTEIVGHEALHCFFGKYHVKPE